MVVGIDAGSKSYGIFILEDRKLVEIESERVRNDPYLIVEVLRELSFDVAAGLSGYGLPVKLFNQLTENDIFLMTLKKEENRSIGLRGVIKSLRNENFKIYTIPGVIHLPTVPEFRKINRIDMGTSDKVCSVALAIAEGYSDFILAELGYGFNSFIAVRDGKIIDGIGGTSGFPSNLSISAIDAELVWMLDLNEKSGKDIVFSGGLGQFLQERNLKFSMEIFSEWVLKGINAVNTVVKTDLVLLSGRFAENVKKFIEGYEVKILQGFGTGKQAAEGAAIIANGLEGGEYRDVVSRLELRKARGSVFDYLTSDIIRFLKAEFRSKL